MLEDMFSIFMEMYEFCFKDELSLSRRKPIIVPFFDFFIISEGVVMLGEYGSCGISTFQKVNISERFYLVRASGFSAFVQLMAFKC